MTGGAPAGLLIIHLLPFLSPIFYSAAAAVSPAATTFSSRPPPNASSIAQFFPHVPVQSPPPLPTTNVSSNISPRPHHSGAAKKIAVGVSISVAALALLLSMSAFFVYRKRARPSDDSENLVGNENHRRFPCSAATSELRTMEASARRVDGDSNSSPYRKLSSSRALGVQHPSPELRPMPPLIRPPRRIHPPVAALYDEDAFYTPPRSTASIASDSPCSTVSRKSLPAITTGKDSVDSTAHSMKAPSNCGFPEAKQAIRQSTRKPPPLPPRPPPRPAAPRAEKTTRSAPPPPNEIGHRKQPPSDVSVLPVPTQATFRRQWVKPTSPAEAPIPIAGVSNGGSCSSSEVFDEEEDSTDRVKLKLKPLHWDKVRASSDLAMVWDQLRSSSFRLNEERIGALFCSSTNSVTKGGNRRPALPTFKEEAKVLDPKKSQNIAILLRALNVTREEVAEALLDGNPECLGVELLETLVKLAPTKEEELRLRDYTGDISKLGSAEGFLKTVLDVPFAFRRAEALLYQANFETEVKYLRESFDTLEAACHELKSSQLFLKLLEAVLVTGNKMNDGTNRGEAKAFKLDTLLKLVDVKGADGKITLLHFVIQQIIRSEEAGSETMLENNPLTSDRGKEGVFKKQGLQVVSGLSKELASVKKAAGMDLDVLRSYITKLSLGLQKIKSVLQLQRSGNHGTKFFEIMDEFLRESENEIASVKAEERRVLSLIKETTEYFHGDTAKEEARPIRIFMVLRDFLSALDHACKEVERMHESTIVGTGASLPKSTAAALPVTGRYVESRDDSSNDDSWSP